MIVKRSSRRSGKSSSFSRLVRYITREDAPAKEAPPNPWTVNCGVEDVGLATRVVEATQALNTRARADKTYHLIVSFDAQARVDLAAVRTIEGRLAEALGYGEHQRVCALHTDTDHTHLHVAINKVHPISRHAITPRGDFRALSRAAAELEIEFDLARTHSVPSRAPTIPTTAAQMEAHGGRESFASWIRAHLAPDLDATLAKCESWADVHRQLAAQDLQLRRRGAGLVLVAPNGATCKASTAGRPLAYPALTSRFGAFEQAQPHAERPERRYEGTPRNRPEKDSPLWREYSTERQRAQLARRTASGKAASDLLAAKLGWRMERQHVDQNRSLSGTARWHAFDILAKQRRAWLTSSHAQTAQARADHPLPTWQDWLIEKAASGSDEALALLRSRPRPLTASASLAIHGSGPSRHLPAAGLRPSIRKNGDAVYQLGNASLRDTGAELQLSASDPDALRTALELAVAKWGPELSLRGDDAFREAAAQAAGSAALAVRFSDPDLDRRRAIYAEIAPLRDEAAIDRWIDGRNTLRRSRLRLREGILPHRRFSEADAGPGVYRGTRQIESSHVALIERAGAMLVVPASARQTSRLAGRRKIGEPVRVNRAGHFALPTQELDRE